MHYIYLQVYLNFKLETKTSKKNGEVFLKHNSDLVCLCYNMIFKLHNHNNPLEC